MTQRRSFFGVGEIVKCVILDSPDCSNERLIGVPYFHSVLANVCAFTELNQ